MVDRNNINAILDEILTWYIKYRRVGANRLTAIELIRRNYAEELQDEDDKLLVLIALSLALCKQNELYEDLAVETISELHLAYQNSTFTDDSLAYLHEIERYLLNSEFYGNEASYSEKLRYAPSWKKGDIFIHEMTYPASESLGIMGWYILFYKVGEYVDEVGVTHQLVYVSLCPPERIPSCENEVKDIAFLRMMQLGDKSEYLAQITIKSKKEEESFGLTLIGCYPCIHHPRDYRIENPCTAMPLLGFTKRNDQSPGFEDQICRLYRKFGL